jgi:peptide/nickel transport system permease protein
MTQYIIRRLFQAIPLLILITVFVFFLIKAAGDPLLAIAMDPTATEADQAIARARFGLDDPLALQFIHWLIGDDWYTREINLGDSDDDGEDEILVTTGERQGILRGDLGISLSRDGRPVTEVIGIHLPRTVLLGTSALLVTITASFALGIFAALNQYSLADNIITGAAFLTFSIPVFLVALILVQIFAVQFYRWGLPRLPVEGMYYPRGDRSFDELLVHLILPTMSLALISIASYSRYIRSTMLEVINADYVRTARSKGLAERRVLYLHALKNASLPIVTLIGLDIPFILSGAVITETIFSWQGMGWMFITALEELDQALLSATVLLIAIAVVAFQLITDIVYALLDPRIRYS